MALSPTSSRGGAAAGVNSVAAADTSIVVGGTAADPTVRTGTLDVIATDHPPAADVAMNAKKITGLANAAAATDAAAFGQVGVTSLAAADTSVVVAGTAGAPTVRTATLDVIATVHPPAADVAMNAKKITGLGNGVAATDALAVGQVLAAGVIPIGDLVDPGAGKVIGSNGGAAAVRPPGYQWDFASIATNATGVQTTEATAGVVIDGNSVVYDGTQVELRCWAPIIATTTAGAAIHHVLLRDSTVLANITVGPDTSGPYFDAPLLLSIFDTPAAGAHTYHWKSYISSGTWIVEAGAGGSGTLPAATLRVLKV